MAAMQMPQDNHLLAALSENVQMRFFPHMQLVELHSHEVLDESRGPAGHIYFPTTSVISLQSVLKDGASTALSIVGNEGLVGINLCLAEKSAPNQALVQSPGFAFRLPKQLVKEEFNRHDELMLLMLRYTQALIAQISQTAVCNRHHTIPQQLCRWLLISLDHVSGTNLTLTQEFMSHVLGVRREGITEAASNLQNMGVISYSRGLITVLDRQKLEALACECYQIVKTETDLVLNY